MSLLGQKIFKEGIEEGIEKGKLEEKYNIARELIDVLTDKMIAEKCGLSLQKVKQLRKEYEEKK